MEPSYKCQQLETGRQAAIVPASHLLSVQPVSPLPYWRRQREGPGCALSGARLPPHRPVLQEEAACVQASVPLAWALAWAWEVC